MCRKLYASLLVGVVLFHSMGLFFSFQFLQNLADQHAQSVMNGKYRPVQYTTFRVQHDALQYKNTSDGSFFMNGKVYKIRKLQKNHHATFVICWYDQNNSDLYQWMTKSLGNSQSENETDATTELLKGFQSKFPIDVYFFAEECTPEFLLNSSLTPVQGDCPKVLEGINGSLFDPPEKNSANLS